MAAGRSIRSVAFPDRYAAAFYGGSRQKERLAELWARTRGSKTLIPRNNGLRRWLPRSLFQVGLVTRLWMTSYDGNVLLPGVAVWISQSNNEMRRRGYWTRSSTTTALKTGSGLVSCLFSFPLHDRSGQEARPAPPSLRIKNGKAPLRRPLLGMNSHGQININGGPFLMTVCDDHPYGVHDVLCDVRDAQLSRVHDAYDDGGARS